MKIERLHTFSRISGTIGILLALATVVLLAIGCATVPRPGVARDRATQAATAVRVEVLCVDEDPLKNIIEEGVRNFHVYGGVGSGVMIDGRRALTAYHVIACPYLPDVHIVFADGTRLRVVVTHEWEEFDVAMVELQSAGGLAIVSPRVVSPPPKGTPVCSSVAYPRREWNCGEVEIQRDRDAGFLGAPFARTRLGDVAVSMRIVRGNSGAPVYDLAGNLVGLVVDGDPSESFGRLVSLFGKVRP